ncbi:MAG: ABC transporter ATP-binding protein, partial [Candidatus Nanopelagicales bacterium]
MTWGSADREVVSTSPAGGAADAPASLAVWCSGLAKRYGQRQAVSGVSLQVGRGEVVGLLGANGAGKTTLIKMMLGLVRPDAGEVMLLGRPGNDPLSRLKVGYLPELFRYQPWLSADEVLTLHGRLTHAQQSADTRLELLRTVGLRDRAFDRLGDFSKGMQQRLGLAVALVGDPELVVLDEPTSALDPLGRVEVRDLVLSLRDRGVAVLLNSHLIGEVERVCDRVVILDHGRVVTAGTLSELLGQRQVTLRLNQVSDEARARLREAGVVAQSLDVYTVTLGDEIGDADPESHDVERSDAEIGVLVADLVGLGVQVYGVER